MNSSRTIRLVSKAIVALILAMSAIGAFDFFTAREASATAEPVWHWNIFGTCKPPGNCGGIAPVIKLNQKYTAATSKPWMMSLNEVCDREFAELFARFYTAGYKMIFAKTNGVPGTPSTSPVPGHSFHTVDCGTPDKISGQFGNAVLMLGNYQARSDHYFSSQELNGDVRALSCMVVNFFGVRKGCVSHFDPTGTPATPGQVTIDQDNTTAFLFGIASNAGERLTLGADRNTINHGPWTPFTEIDTASPKLRTHSNVTKANKLDWIFGGAGHWGVVGTTRYCAPAAPKPISDHCMLMGTFLI